ncbi:MBL fold metallo-hydrolase [Ectobacillus ponti]|uniref:MBL fold metallo-hydrolase n=1 Tax=Ectobacillus ponti TaxID=2961894 RepID=A0AA41XCC8_9BACI|nr:MBL fold metallo-hydrolase [Ectobacillus ponti]MCP8969466.1 MBL fold metallo-hydrolase [Ectobacillus ponti]
MEEDKLMPMTSIASGVSQELAPDVSYLCTQIVNLCFYGSPAEASEYVIIDTGMPKSFEKIMEEAKSRFGDGSRPKAVILTHGHFDHVGAVEETVAAYGVPVYAHELELPYLTGQQSYPPASPEVGGMVAQLSPAFPRDPIQLGENVRPLPADGSVPDMPGWRWIHTPGHSPGHVSLFRDADKLLIAGDAFVTVKQESLYKVVTQKQEISGPPKYFTPDWDAARTSVEKLAALKPAAAITGHGFPMSGEELTESLARLVRDFDTIAVPEQGRYVNE